MIPVMQRIVDKHRGDCMSACIASLLELPYEQVPTWMAAAFDAQSHRSNRDEAVAFAERDEFLARMEWLRHRGLHLLQVNWDDLNDWRGLAGALCILSMPSQMNPGGWHAVVATWEQRGDGGHQVIVVHDPNPSNAPYALRSVTERVGDDPPYALATFPGVTPRWVEFLVPINPARALHLSNPERHACQLPGFLDLPDGRVMRPMNGSKWTCPVCDRTWGYAPHGWWLK